MQLSLEPAVIDVALRESVADENNPFAGVGGAIPCPLTSIAGPGSSIWACGPGAAVKGAWPAGTGAGVSALALGPGVATAASKGARRRRQTTRITR